MNWLIIATDIKNQHLKTIEEFLFNKDAEVDEIYLNDLKTDSDLLSAMTSIARTSYCAVIDSDGLSENKYFSFFMGILAGRSVPVYLMSDKQEFLYSVSDKTSGVNFSVYKDVKKLLSALKSGYSDFEKDSFRKASLSDLYLKGIPFTADGISCYLEKDFKKPEEEEQNKKIIEQFIAAGMDVNAYNSDGVPLLSVATRCDKADYVKYLLKNGAQIDQISKDRGYSALMDAVWRKNFEITKLLVDKGARLDFVSSDGQPVMVLAVGNGNVKISELLLKNGADPDLQDSMGMSARAYASLFKNQELIDLIQKYQKK